MAVKFSILLLESLSQVIATAAFIQSIRARTFLRVGTLVLLCSCSDLFLWLHSVLYDSNARKSNMH